MNLLRWLFGSWKAKEGKIRYLTAGTRVIRVRIRKTGTKK